MELPVDGGTMANSQVQVDTRMAAGGLAYLSPAFAGHGVLWLYVL